MRTQRALVDYALQKRAVLAQLTSGRAGLADVCDAQPHLVQAAKYHGVPAEAMCPVCRKEPLTHVYWVYGDQLGPAAGSARTPEELERMAGTFSEFSVYQVEVCRSCSWNHLVASFVLGEADEPVRRGSGRSGRRPAAQA